MYQNIMTLLHKSRFAMNLVSKSNKTTLIARMSSKPSQEIETKATLEQHHSSHMNRRTHVPTELEKKILVWTGRYKSIEEIPQTVTVESVEKARNRARVKFANYIILATIIACFVMAISGRRAAARGESVAKMNKEWHKQMNKEAEK